MPIPDKSPYSPDQVMMTHSAIAYTRFSTTAVLQSNLHMAEALERAYQVIWWARDEERLLYVAKREDGEHYVLAIRGSIFQFGLSCLFDLYETLDIANLVPFHPDKLENARVSAGILDTAGQMSRLIYNGINLSQLVHQLPPGSKLYVTGHSLGGTLATVLAARMVLDNPNKLDIIPYTFGAPSAGNASFADLHHPGSGHFSGSYRCLNSRDMIAYAWNHLQGIPDIEYGTLKCPIDFILCLDCLARLLIVSGAFYAQPPVHWELPGPAGQHTHFFSETQCQHQPNTYLAMLGLGAIRGISYTDKQKKQPDRLFLLLRP